MKLNPHERMEVEGLSSVETHSRSSHEVRDEYDDDGEESTSSSLSHEEDETMEENNAVVSFWKQHWVAIVVSLVATFVGHLYNHTRQFPQFPQPLEFSAVKHGHVENFLRTANISFCQSLSQTIGKSSGLQLMDFFMSKDYFDILQGFYIADFLDDDLYEQTTAMEIKALPKIGDPEYQCLIDQRHAGTAKFRGTTYYYKSPTMEEIYPELEQVEGSVQMSRKRRLQQPPLAFTGFAAKFVNLSPKPVLLFWDGKGGDDHAKKLVGEIAPFESLGTATMPGHSFHVTAVCDSSTPLQRWVLTIDTALVYYEPYTAKELGKGLISTPSDWDKYKRQLVNQAFARDYLIASQRTWFGHFPRRFPMLYMYPGNYIGEEHSFGHFTLKVASVTPRVLVINNFLTPEECVSIIETSQQQGLQHSTLHSGATVKQTRDLSTRSSTNTWLPRDTNDLTEKIYRQAAQVMQIDPDLFQKFHETSAHHHSIAESLQVVRYKQGGEEYQPHHDFVYPSINHRYQPTRFATLLMYLNTVPEGGETRFPRAVNNYNAEGLEVKPKVGQAVLFYNLLEDGNVDDLSQHGSNPTTKYDKWLANLWVWDPVID